MTDPNRPPVALEYAGPPPLSRGPLPTQSRSIGALRQFVFAVGLAFAFYGLGQSIRGPSDGPPFMAFGGLLVGLAWKFRRGDRL